QPSEPPIEYAGVPDALSVFASERSCAKVFGALMPAFLNAGTLYQRRALLDELLHVARLSDVRHVRGMPTGDGGREDGRDVVAQRLVVHVNVRLDLVERGDHPAEGGCLRAGPDAVERDRPLHGG